MKVPSKGIWDGRQLSVFITMSVKKVKQSIHLSYQIHASPPHIRHHAKAAEKS